MLVEDLLKKQDNKTQERIIYPSGKIIRSARPLDYTRITMSKWYLEKLYETTNQSTLRFAFQGTVNWIAPFYVERKVFRDKTIKQSA